MQPALAPLPVVTPSPPLAPTLETLIGECTAAAAFEVAKATLTWLGTGRRDCERGAERIAELVLLRQASIGKIVDFNYTARTRGRQVLRARLPADVSDAFIDLTIDGTLEIVEKVIRCQVN